MRSPTLDPAQPTPPPSLQRAIENVLTTGQQLLMDRIDLMQVELQSAAETFAARVALVLLCSICGISAFIAVSIALAQGLTLWLPSYAATAVVALLHGALCYLGAKRLARDKKDGSDADSVDLQVVPQ